MRIPTRTPSKTLLTVSKRTKSIVHQTKGSMPKALTPLYLKNMEKNKITHLILLLGLIAACSSANKEIKEIAQKYLDATGCYDIPEACRYCTPETANGLRTLDTTLMLLVDSTFIQQNTPATIHITNLTMVCDSVATITYHKKTPIQEFDGELKMVLRGGQWMAHAPIKMPPMLRQQHQTLDPQSIEEKIASGELKLTAEPFKGK